MLPGFLLSTAAAVASVTRLATARWDFTRQDSSMKAPLLDWSGNGHHGYFGGVKRAFIGDTVYGDRGLHLPAVSGNYASVPDSAANRPTGDQWFYWRGRLVDFSTGSSVTLHGRWTASGNLRSSYIGCNGTGAPLLVWSPDGTLASQVSVTCSATLYSVGVIDLSEVEIYAALDVDNGAGGYEVEFYWRLPGGSWAQLGTTTTGGSTTSVFAGTAAWETSINVGTGQLAAGRFYRCAMGTGLTVFSDTTLDADFSTLAQGTPSFTCTTGQTVTINQSGSSTAEPTRLWHGGTTHVWFPGTANNAVRVAADAGYDVTDFEVELDLSVTTWGTGNNQTLVGRDNCWSFYVDNAGIPTVLVLPSWGSFSAGSAFPVTAGVRFLAKAEFDADNGASGATCVFKYSTNGGASWTTHATIVGTLGAPDTGVHGINIMHGAGGDSPTGGRIYRATLRNGIGGTDVLDVDFTDAAAYSTDHTTVTAVTSSSTVTISRSTTGLKTAVVDRNLVVFDGVDDYVSVDDHDRLNFGATESFTVSAAVRYHGAPTGFMRVINKRAGASGAVGGYALLFDNTNHQIYAIIGDGTIATSTASAGYVTTTEGARSVFTSRRDVGSDTLSASVDGAGRRSVTDATTGSLSVSNNLNIGRESTLPGAWYRGEITSAALFRRALTDAQISRLRQELR